MAEDIVDLRTLAQEWRDELGEIDIEIEPEEIQAQTEGIDQRYADLCSELGIEPTPDELERWGDNYDPTLIADSYFETYAQELAEDIGAIPSEHTWPASYIDWERAAEALQMDYTSVEFDGETYWYRA